LFGGVIEGLTNNELYSCDIFTTNISWGSERKKEVLLVLVKIKFLVKTLYSRNNYEISNKYKKDAMLVTSYSSGYSVNLIDIIKAVNAQTFNIIEKDIDDFFLSE
jgi:hypothetical protein